MGAVEECDRFPTITLKEIRTDGQIWIWTHYGSDYAAYKECIENAAKEQASRRVAVTNTPVLAGGLTAAVAPPAIRPGSEWAYRWESPQGKGTFVYVLDREEVRDGSTWFVLKSGTRELYYRKTDLALWLETVDGDTETRRSPPVLMYKWPLTVGQEWEQTYTFERVKERQSEEIQTVCKIDGQEAVTVPAGSFQAFKSVCRNKRTGRTIFEVWYSPEVGSFVRELSAQRAGGTRERELIQYLSTGFGSDGPPLAQHSNGSRERNEAISRPAASAAIHFMTRRTTLSPTARG